MTQHPPLEASPEMLALLERAKAHKMTPEKIDAQRRSWVRGQMGLSDPNRTPEQIDAALDAVLGPPLSAQLAAAREAGRREGMEEAAAWHEGEASRLSGGTIKAVDPAQAPRLALMRDVVFHHQWSAARLRGKIAALPRERPEAPT